MVARVFPMWPSNGRLIGLKDILRLVGDNCWEWRIHDLEGTGSLPYGMSWDEFDEKVDAVPYVLAWSDLVNLADGLVQVTNGEIRAICAGEETARIAAFDSSEWTVDLRVNEVCDFEDRLDRLLADAA
ncbi:hypothetical protein [Saccharopolyspora sp. SCSIO 74807]|uniref:hypothetical protein n=2 Tax=Saccharopolyspora TaxID=1835 RepID=UPI0030D437DA